MAAVWSLSVELAFTDNSKISVGKISDAGGERFLAGTQANLDLATRLPELNAFLTSIGYGNASPGNPPTNVKSYSFRFHSVATGSILVLGGNKELASTVVTNDLDATLAELNKDPGFVKFMSLVSCPGEVLTEDDTGISFESVIGTKRIAAASGTPFAGLIATDQIKIIGSASNDRIFTVSSVELAGARIVTSEFPTAELAGASITIVKL